MTSIDSLIAQIANEAYFYGYPMLDNYKVIYSYYKNHSFRTNVGKFPEDLLAVLLTMNT